MFSIYCNEKYKFLVLFSIVCVFFVCFYGFALKEFSTIGFDSCLSVTRMFFKTSTRFRTEGRYVNERSKYNKRLA